MMTLCAILAFARNVISICQSFVDKAKKRPRTLTNAIKTMNYISKCLK
jgi:hypothetical protein